MPVGLMLAQSLPCFQNIILPAMTVLESYIQACTNHERYQKQLLQTAQALNSSQHTTIIRAWEMLKRYGVALPQEYFFTKT